MKSVPNDEVKMQEDDGREHWVLCLDGTDSKCLHAQKDGVGENMLLTFDTEQDALDFAEKYEVKDVHPKHVKGSTKQ